ncbi:MAG: hypothetical protein ABIV47_22210 [Roseiflexaceae bacterium]
MDQRTEPIRQDIDSIRDSMADKLGQIETKIKGTVDDTRRMVDVKYQVSQRPWAALGVSLLVGYTLGSIGGDDTRAQPQRAESFRYYDEPKDERARSTRERDIASREYAFTQPADTRHPAKPGMLDQIMDQFGDEFQMLKAAAITSVIGLVRDTVRQNLPALDQEIGRLRSEKDGSTTPSASARANDTARKSNGNDSSRYYDTADTATHDRAVGEISTQADVGRSTNYDFIPPAPHAEPGGRP